MNRVRLSRKRVALLIATAAVVTVIVVGLLADDAANTSNPMLTPSASVLSPAYARSVGFSTITSPAKKVGVSNEKGCSTSIEAVYENAASKTGLISDLLNCKSEAAASAVLTAFRKQVRGDSAIAIPSQLGPSAIATASRAPEYLLAWQVGSRIALLALDTDIAATSSSAATPISKSQATVLEESAIRQNALYS